MYNFEQERKELRGRKSKARLAEERQLEEFKQLLKFPGNRYWIWRLLEQCGYFGSVSRSDTHSMTLASGKRDVGVWVMNELFRADPKAFTIIQQEAVERDNG